MRLRATGLAIRLRDPESPLRRTFTGRRWFPVDGGWVLTGRFVPYDAPKTIAAQNILGDNTPTRSPGEVEVTIAGTTVRLIAYEAREGLSFVFRDATGGGETYRIRFLSAAAPKADGSVVLDFNRAYNPPCAFNPHTTCPVPPPQNRLRVSIPAGEKVYVAADGATHAASAK